jgi:PleD family two-component response regulator
MPRTKLQDAHKVVNRIIENFKTQTTTNISFSVGLVSTGPDEILSADKLITLADSYMYKAKALSREEPGFHVCTSEADFED